jgi:hypothetical protein
MSRQAGREWQMPDYKLAITSEIPPGGVATRC